MGLDVRACRIGGVVSASQAPPVLEKTCSACQTPKPLTDFSPSATGRFGTTSACKSCEARRAAARRQPSRDQRRALVLAEQWERYGKDLPVCGDHSGCVKPAVWRGLCRNHYKLRRRDGSLPPAFPPIDPSDKLWGSVDRTGDCWPWLRGVTSQGYGEIRVSGREVHTHRLAYELCIGPIPTGYTIDHTCHNTDPSCPGGPTCLHRRCCNPAHLEAVTRAENTLRGKGVSAVCARKTACKRGHDFTVANTIWNKNGSRKCRTCRNALRRKAGRDAA